MLQYSVNFVNNSTRTTNFVGKCFDKLRNMPGYSFTFIILGLLILIFSVSFVQNTLQNNATDKIKLVIDVDAGVDDAMAILYLLRVQKHLQEQNKENEFEILGITCVRGNTLVENVAINVLRTLKVAHRLDIPVFKGASQSILVTPPFNEYFGQDGFGDVHDPDPPPASLIQSEHAVTALLRLVDENPGEITILALGPLTNIALAIRMDENFLKNIKNIIILGGCVEGIGNILPGVEYNFFVDPEAVHIVLNGTEVDPGVISLFPWEAVLKTSIPMKWRKEELGALQSDEILFMNSLEHIDNHTDEEQLVLGDPMAAMMVLNSDIVTKRGQHGITTITTGLTRGATAVDYDNFLNSANKIDIIFQIDAESLKSMLIKYFT